MSIGLMTVAWQLPDLSMAQKFVLVALCDSANDDGVCFPSVGALMRKCNLSDRGVRKITAELEEMGFLSKKKRVGHSTVYVVCPSAGVVKRVEKPEKVIHTPAPRAGGVLHDVPVPLHHVQGGPARGAGITQIEPKKKQRSIVRESFANETVFETAEQWAQFFIAECGYPLHVVQTAKTIPLFVQWCGQGICVGDVRAAILAFAAWAGVQFADSPVAYGKFLTSVLTNRAQAAEQFAFDARNGPVSNRAVEDWAKVPKDDNALEAWAVKHGFPRASPGSSYRQYRVRLNELVEKRLQAKVSVSG